MDIAPHGIAEIDPHRLDIVRLAWCRELELDDAALSTDSPRVEHTTQAEDVTVLMLAGTTVVVGPAWAVTASRASTPPAAAHGPSIASLLGDRSGDYDIQSCTLAYGSDIGHSIGVHDPLISHDAVHVRNLADHTSGQDVDEAFGGSVTRNWFTLLGDDRPAATAQSLSAAGYAEVHNILADLRVLTAPNHRRKGYGQSVAQLATNDAIDDGLVPQWRSRPENATARRLAARLGYTEIGSCHTAALRR